MATSEELFISISPESYRKNKSSVLMGQAELLQILKHFQNLKVLSGQKNDLKLRLQKLMSSTISSVESLQNKMPTPKIPKTVRNKNFPTLSITPQIGERKTFSKVDEIEDELKLIQEKLRELNS